MLHPYMQQYIFNCNLSISSSCLCTVKPWQTHQPNQTPTPSYTQLLPKVFIIIFNNTDLCIFHTKRSPQYIIQTDTPWSNNRINAPPPFLHSNMSTWDTFLTLLKICELLVSALFNYCDFTFTCTIADLNSWKKIPECERKSLNRYV